MTALESSTFMESCALVAPVTALEFLGDDYLLTGEGPVLSVFSLQASPQQCRSLSVLHNYRIHGIRPKQQDKSDVPEPPTLDYNVKLVVFGGKGVRLINFKPCGHGLEVASSLMELQDWVLDVSWLRGETSSLLGVSLAHNAALLLEAGSGKVLTLCCCVEACLLYSSLLIGPNWETSVLVGGTVFNQLVMWKPGGAGADGRTQVERRLLGHNGVIFSLCYLQSSGRLASASDDRSVRVWHVGKLGGNGGCGEEPTCLQVLYGHQARVFCVRLVPDCVFSAGEDGACLLWEWGGGGRVGRTLKGHRSGGIRALAVSNNSEGEGRRWVATGGADGGIRLWQVLEQSSEGKLCDNQTDLGFSGRGSPKVLRSVGDHDAVLVCTDQGEVFLHQDGLWKSIWNGGPEFQSYCVMEVKCIQPQNSSSDEGVWLCAVGNLVGGVYLFPIHQPGAGLYLEAGEGKLHTLQWVEKRGSRGCSLYLLASGSEGLVYRWIVEVEEVDTGLALMLEKIRPFLLPPCAKRWLTAAVMLRCGNEELWVCGDRRGSLLLYRDSEKGKNQEGKNQEATDREKDAENLGLENDGITPPITPVSTLFGVHGKQGVTSICEHWRVFYSTGRDGCVRVLTINGDSLYVRRIHRACKGMDWLEKVIFLDPVESEADPLQAIQEKDHEERMTKSMLNSGANAEERDGSLDVSTEELNKKCSESKKDGETQTQSEASFVMAGFHSVQFVLWDPLRQEKLFSVACGGGHRSWAYIPPPGAQTRLSNHTLRRGTLAFIKQGAVMMSQSLTSTSTQVRGHTLREGLHGRGLSCVYRLGNISKPEVCSESWEVFITGGEDTTVTILAVKPEQNTVKVLAVLADHISNVKTLAAVPRGDKEDEKSTTCTDSRSSFSTLVFSAGGRAQLQCYCLLIGWDELSNRPVCQVTQIAGHRLDEQWERRRNRHKTVKMDPETRYMSMAVVHDGIEEVLLALACSDGAVRLFSVREDRKVQLLWESFHHQRCVLSVSSCSLEDLHSKRHVLLLSGATDGAVALWDLTAVLESKCRDSWPGPSAPCFSVPVHQSGVNTLVILEHHEAEQLTKHVITVASGGDDGQLSVMKIRVDLNQPDTGRVCPQLLSHWSVPLAHSAPLTGLSPLTASLLVSTSPDQRVCVWRLCEDGLHHQGAVFSHTADAAGLGAWWREGPELGGGAYVVVCGQGLELFKITELQKDEERTREKEQRQKVLFADLFSQS